MAKDSAHIEQVHRRAIEISKRYLNTESEFIDVLQQIEQYRIFVQKGYPSLFQYIVQELRLSENVAYNFITVSRKAREVPALKAEIQSGRISLSNAKRISSVLTVENQDEWLDKARTFTSRQLEKAIAKIKPKLATVERVTYVSESRLRVEIGLEENELLKLKRAQDLLSKARQTAVSLEDTLNVVVEEYLKRHDPVERAKRNVMRRVSESKVSRSKGSQYKRSQVKVKSSEDESVIDLTPEELVTRRVREIRRIALKGVSRSRKAIPRMILDQVYLRDEGRCTFILPNQKRCNQSRWTEIHHLQPVAEGGEHVLDNLTTLCSAHHERTHMKFGQFFDEDYEHLSP